MKNRNVGARIRKPAPNEIIAGKDSGRNGRNSKKKYKVKVNMILLRQKMRVFAIFASFFAGIKSTIAFKTVKA
jgi:hypothetical protein